MVVDDISTALSILDTAGQEEYALLREQFMRTGDGFLCIFSITDADSLESIEAIHNQILRVKDKAWFPCVLVGNKCDLEHDREVSTKDAMAVAERWNVPYIEASAKTRVNVEHCFHSSVRQVREVEALREKPAPSSEKSPRKKKVACSIL